MAIEPRTWISGELVTAILGNQEWRDLVARLYGGEISVPDQAANDLIAASSSQQLARVAAAASAVLVTSAGSVPSLAQTLPNAVQDNITRLGTIAVTVIFSETLKLNQTNSRLVVPVGANKWAV